MDLLEDLRKSSLNFSFAMICVIHKILVLIKNHLNYPKDNIFEYFFQKYNRLLIFLKNLFRLEKALNCTAIKDIRNLFRQEIETEDTL